MIQPVSKLCAVSYGFKNVITPGDLIKAFPTLWPFASPRNYNQHARPLTGKKLSSRVFASNAVKDPVRIDAVFVFNDPRDWALDTQVILDLLLSHKGYLGSLSPKNNDSSLPNRGYLQDDQPTLYFSNPDLFWAAAYHLPRLGQGGFREAFEGVWNAVTGGPAQGVRLQARMYGKPHQGTFGFAEKRLVSHRQTLLGSGRTKIGMEGLKRVYMVGDNPESDILGANQYTSPVGSTWHSILVRSGVYSGGEPFHKPKAIVHNVWDAVQWALKQEGSISG